MYNENIILPDRQNLFGNLGSLWTQSGTFFSNTTLTMVMFDHLPSLLETEHVARIGNDGVTRRGVFSGGAGELVDS